METTKSVKKAAIVSEISEETTDATKTEIETTTPKHPPTSKHPQTSKTPTSKIVTSKSK